MTTTTIKPSSIEVFWSRVDMRGKKECWNWIGGCNPKGYGQISRDDLPDALAHRIAYILTKGAIARGKNVCHECDNKKCCNPSHLFVGTQMDNMQDMISKGRDFKAYGDGHGIAKLKSSDIPVIRDMVKKGHTRKETARIFGVSRTTIDNIVNRVVWTHIP